MAITWTDVLNVAPDLSTVPNAARAAILDTVFQQLVEDVWGNRYDDACAYLAAHYGTVYLRGANGPAGPLASESVGPVSRAYMAFSPPGSDPTLDSTSYGKEYRRLLMLCGRARVPLVT